MPCPRHSRRFWWKCFPLKREEDYAPGLDEDEDDTDLVHYIDSESGRIVLSSNKAQQLADIKKQSQLDLGVVRDSFVPRRRAHLRKPTEEMLADPLTKLPESCKDTMQAMREARGAERKQARGAHRAGQD